MALYIPHSIFHLPRLLYVRPETFVPYYEPKATNTYSDYVILVALPLQQWLHESASMLRYTYTASLVLTCLHYVVCSAGGLRMYL